MATHVLHQRMARTTIAIQERVRKQDIQVGKDLLELVTGAMYINPLDVYREFFQNSADSLDARRATGPDFSPLIEIQVDVQDRRALIRDNGQGVDKSKFPLLMLSLGASSKRGSDARGFRGIGRLAGLGYCQTLLFRSKGPKDKDVMQVSWDGRAFRRVMRDPRDKRQVLDVISEVATLEALPTRDSESFFEVELRGVVRLKDDVLLNIDAIQQYLSQVAPVRFHDNFAQRDIIVELLRHYGIGDGYETTIQEVGHVQSEPIQICRPYRTTFDAANRGDSINSIQTFEVPDVESGVAAFGWIANHSYLGAIPRSSLVSGLRGRVGNIQIGADNLFAELFPEPRFNGWTIGEVHVVSRRIVPNGRRDNFEESAHLLNLRTHLIPKLKEISRTCRAQSIIRQWSRRIEAAENAIKEKLLRLENGSLSKRQRNRLAKSIDESIVDLESKILSSKHDFAKTYLSRVKALRTKLNSLLRRKLSSRDPLRGVPYQKRLAFQELFELIHDVSANRVVANQLVDRITRRLSAKYEPTR